ncbi:Metallo-hydrolase/oxidoreductase [Aureobasidium pullulans]|nr:Metallo-hydrolase/oxidoreductase [Aureobasidium pullulans]
MSIPHGFKSSLEITHITTATAIIDIDGVKFITDPVFAPAGTEYPYPTTTLRLSDDPAIPLNALPAIDAVLLSHEDHEDNLDEITGVPAIHLPGGECTGFIISTESFGHAANGLPNAIYFSGDTIYHSDLLKMNEKWHIVAAVLNLGNAHVPTDPSKPEDKLQITMGGEDGARLVKELDADVLIPMHYQSWGHFTEGEEDLIKIFKQEGVEEKIRWLTPSGKSVKIF